MSTLDTEVVENAIKKGDEKAFELIFVTYFNKVKYFIVGLIKSQDDAEELAQDIFVKLWMNRETIDFEKNLSSYLHTAARNATINFLKSKFVRDSYASDQIYQGEEKESVEENYYAQETALLIKMAVSQMPEKRKEIFELSREKGLSNEEIANQLGISKKTVENQLSLALKEIRKIITFFFTPFIL